MLYQLSKNFNIGVSTVVTSDEIQAASNDLYQSHKVSRRLTAVF